MRVAHKTDVGKLRENNEDSIFIDDEKGIFLLADGMGGHRAGEVASKMALDEVYGYLKNEMEAGIHESKMPDLLASALFKAHGAVQEKASGNMHLRGMATTVVMMVLRDDRAYICHVGDSRVYLIRNHIRPLTKDHLVALKLIEKENMPLADIPYRSWHTLTQAVGGEHSLVPELHEVKVEEGDMFLLCSDGLTNMLNDEEILTLVKNEDDNLNSMVDELIAGANNKGGRDNISVVLVKI